MFTSRASTCYFGYREISVLEAMYIEGSDETTVRDVADLLNLKVSAVQFAITRLLSKGYVRRKLEGFRFFYQLTDKGAKVAPQSSRIKKLFPPEFATAKNVGGKSVVLLHHRADRTMGKTLSTWKV